MGHAAGLPVPWPADVTLSWLFAQRLTQPGLLSETETCTLTNSSRAVFTQCTGRRKQDGDEKKLSLNKKHLCSSPRKKQQQHMASWPPGCISLRCSLTQISEIPPVLDSFRAMVETDRKTLKGTETGASTSVGRITLQMCLVTITSSLIIIGYILRMQQSSFHTVRNPSQFLGHSRGMVSIC